MTTLELSDLCRRLSARARGRCECCSRPFAPGVAAATLDHFFGRARAEESAATCWLLRADCHRAKTDNAPSAREWHERWIRHAERHGYVAEAARARARLEGIITLRERLP